MGCRKVRVHLDNLEHKGVHIFLVTLGRTVFKWNYLPFTEHILPASCQGSCWEDILLFDLQRFHEGGTAIIPMSQIKKLKHSHQVVSKCDANCQS